MVRFVQVWEKWVFGYTTFLQVCFILFYEAKKLLKCHFMQRHLLIMSREMVADMQRNKQILTQRATIYQWEVKTHTKCKDVRKTEFKKNVGLKVVIVVSTAVTFKLLG